MKINLGSGIKRFDGFLNLDIDPSSNPDYVCDLNKDNLPFSDSTVEYVLAHHVFEHIGDGFFNLLKEIYRVCENDAIIDVVVPHPRHDCFIGDLSHVRPITIENMRPLSKKYCESQYYINSSWRGFANILDVDFEIFEYNYILDDTFKSIIADITDENQINWMARAMNNAITEIHFKMMAIKNA